MKTLKVIGIFLLVLLLVFMIKGMILGFVFFFFWLKLAFVAGLITGGLYLYFKFRKK